MMKNANYLRVERRFRAFSIGHSDRSMNEFINILEKSSVKMVADIRLNPASVRVPHFERHNLASCLDSVGISYRWFRNLGGLRESSPDDSVNTALKESMRSYVTWMNSSSFKFCLEEFMGVCCSAVTAILCAEKNPRNCHRILLSDKLSLMGVEIVHLLDEHSSFVHEIHPDLTVEATKLIYRTKQLLLL